MTGQLRTIDLTRTLIKNSFSGADFFLSIDRDNLLQAADQNPKSQTEDEQVARTIAFFQPVAFYINSGLPEDYRREEDRNRTARVTKHPAVSRPLTYDGFRAQRLYRKRRSLLRSRVQPLLGFLSRVLGSRLFGALFDKITYRVEFQHKILFEQYHYVHQAFSLMRQHEERTGIDYDVVIRLRFDQLLYDDVLLSALPHPLTYSAENIRLMEGLSERLHLDFQSLSDDEVVVFGHGPWRHYYCVNDQHFVLTSRGARRFLSFYTDLAGLIEAAVETDAYPTHEARIEYFFSVWLARNGFKLRLAKEFGYGGQFVRGLP
jgi:hypothetical protein